MLEAFRCEHGGLMLAAMPTKFIRALLESMTPSAAKNALKAIRALVQHCIDVGLIETDPTLGIRSRPTKGDGHHTWSEQELSQFEAHYPIGSRERLAFALGLYSGQRRGDVIRMGKQHIRDGVLHILQQKTRKPMAIPIHPKLARVLAAVPSNQLTFLQTLRGKPWDGHSFTAWFIDACAEAGLEPRCTFHGLRKAACRRLAEAGCTVRPSAATKA